MKTFILVFGRRSEAINMCRFNNAVESVFRHIAMGRLCGIEHKGSNRATEGADPEGGCSYYRRNKGMAKAFGL